MKLLVSKKEANIPLYLKLACEELCMFGLFEKVRNILFNEFFGLDILQNSQLLCTDVCMIPKINKTTNLILF